MLSYRVVTLDLTNAKVRERIVEDGVGIASVSVRLLTAGGAIQLRYGTNGQPSTVQELDSVGFPALLTDGLFVDCAGQPGKIAELFIATAPVGR